MSARETRWAGLSRSEGLPRWFSPVAVAAVGVAAYAGSLHVPFQFDDIPNIVENQQLHLVALEPGAIWRALASVPGRWLSFLTFALNHRFGGLDPFGYHLVNLAIHLAASWLVLLAAERLLRLLARDLRPPAVSRAALVAALLFVAHPVQTQAVTYLVQRMASLAAMFGLLSLVLYLEGRKASSRRAVWFAGSALALAAGLLCKEHVLLLPVVVVCVEALLLDSLAPWVRRHRGASAALVVCFVGSGAAAGWHYWPVIAVDYDRLGLTVGERLLTEARVLFHYVSIVLLPLPSRLHVELGFSPSRSLFDPPITALAVAGWAVVVIAAVAVRRRAALATFAVVWFLGCLALESSFLPLDLAFEHRLYFPIFGPILAAVWLLEVGASRLGRNPWWVAAPVVALLAAGTLERNRDWADPVRLYEDAVAQAPGLERTRLNLAGRCFASGDLDCAEREYRALLVTEPEHSTVWRNLGNVLRARGDRRGAEACFGRALEFDPSSSPARGGLVQILLDEERWAEAEQVVRELLANDPGYAPAHVVLGELRARTGDLVSARESFETAVRLAPGNPVARRDRARLLTMDGRHAEAAAEYEVALRIQENASLLLETAAVLDRLGRAPEARALRARAAGIHGASSAGSAP